MHITVALMGDEEDSGQPLSLARASLVEAAKAADVAIGLENGADDPKAALTARRGYTGWQIDVKARSAHSSQIFTDDVGTGAIYELARILHTFYDELHGEELLTFNPGLAAGSTQVKFDPQALHVEAFGKDNIVAPVAVATGDLRTISAEQLERTKERMRKIVAASLPHAAATITFNDSGPPMPPTEGNRQLLSMYDAVSRELGFGEVSAVDPRRAGAADISYAADHVEMAIDGIGLLGRGNHTPEEVADLRTFQVQAQRLAVLLMRLNGR
jgi:glutamate carboxypeptidase